MAMAAGLSLLSAAERKVRMFPAPHHLTPHTPFTSFTSHILTPFPLLSLHLPHTSLHIITPSPLSLHLPLTPFTSHILTPSPLHPLHILHISHPHTLPTPLFTPPSHLPSHHHTLPTLFTPSPHTLHISHPHTLPTPLFTPPFTSSHPHTLPTLFTSSPHTSPSHPSHLISSHPPQLCQSVDLPPQQYMSCKMHVLKASALKRAGLPSKPKLPRPLTSDQRSKLTTFFSKSGWS